VKVVSKPCVADDVEGGAAEPYEDVYTEWLRRCALRSVCGVHREPRVAKLREMSGKVTRRRREGRTWTAFSQKMGLSDLMCLWVKAGPWCEVRYGHTGE
jgi:hypothetical protein